MNIAKILREYSINTKTLKYKNWVNEFLGQAIIASSCGEIKISKKYSFYKEELNDTIATLQKFKFNVTNIPGRSDCNCADCLKVKIGKLIINWEDEDLVEKRKLL